MANDFKRLCTPDVGTSLTTIYAVPAGASSAALESIVIGITAANKTTTGVTVDIFIDNEDGSNDVYIVKGASIPAGAALEVMAGNKLVLMNDGTNGDNLEALASAGSSVDITVSVLEDV
ncbi:MAG: hypothetical protein H8D84_00085 [Proteobacteria bacterium]|nr:hypothetical protein [Pseudomonadota bacterium]